MRPLRLSSRRCRALTWRCSVLLSTLVAATPAALAAPGTDRAALPTAEPPPAGRYDARLCVTVGTTPAQCGAVTVDVGDNGQALVRIADLAYRLEVWGEQLGVSLFHGTMQIDGFFAPYQWRPGQLLFTDTEKSTRYDLKLGTRRFDAP